MQVSQRVALDEVYVFHVKRLEAGELALDGTRRFSSRADLHWWLDGGVSGLLPSERARRFELHAIVDKGGKLDDADEKLMKKLDTLARSTFHRGSDG